MRIAQVAPLFESVPPKSYGGTERVVAWLADELVSQGHDVTLFASGDSITKARLEPITHRSLRLDPGCVDDLPHHVNEIERVSQMQDEFDIIHFHLGYLHFPVARRLRTPHVSTQHGRLDIADLRGAYQTFRDLPNISISNDQRSPMPWMNWAATIYHGLPADQYLFHPEEGEYLAFLGRISPEKRVDRAIEIAKRIGVPLKIAAKVDKIDLEYFSTTIRPMLDDSLIEFIGEIADAEKGEFLGRARALLFPIDWPEPFGLVMIESLACGTPVIAYRRGSVPEVLTHGLDGFMVTDVEGAVAAAGPLQIDRRRCRRTFEERFTSVHMARAHVDVYRKVIGDPVARRRDEVSFEAEVMGSREPLPAGRD